MTQDPISVYDSVPEIQILAIMRKNSIHHIPVINQSGEVINVHTVDDHLNFTEFTNHVVIMAGGKGERLRPLTNDCPKPMLKVDGKPILEHILQNCISSGFGKFLISVNYLKEQIKDYFSSGKKWGVEISYIEEKRAMGTCGSLSLVSDLMNQDFLVINGDIFTDLDFGKLLKFHQKQNFPITLCTRNFEMDVPFAVVNSKNSMILNIIEKPVYNFNINAGVYVLSPKTLGEIPNSYFEMTDLVQQFLNEKKGIEFFHYMKTGETSVLMRHYTQF